MSFSVATSVRIRGRDIGPSGGQKTGVTSTAEDVFQKRDTWDGGTISIKTSGSSSSGSGSSGSKGGSFGPFHSVLAPGCTQEHAHCRTMTPLIDSFLNDKMNCTVFAYGQTGSGKTHTLLGPPRFFDLPQSEWGLCPRTGLAILEKVGSMEGEGSASTSSSEPSSCWDLRCSAVELYFDDCYDLLNKKMRVAISGFGKNRKSAASGYTAALTQYDENGKWIPPFQQGENGAFNLIKTTNQEYAAEGTTEKQIKTMEDFLEVMQVVEATRSAKSHALNERSSRSHCVLTMILTTKSGKTQEMRRFLFVDLAGSERINKTGVLETAAAEARNINTSLSALGRCIEALRKANKKTFVPWRDSALTMLMKQSLSGNCRTALIVTVNEDPEMVAETISTLRFGQSCGTLKNRVTAAEKVNTTDQLASLQRSLAGINRQLEEMRVKEMHGELGASEPKPTRDGFVDNYKKLLDFQKQIAAAQKKGEAKNSKYMQDLRFAENNIKDIVVRQMMTPVWREPRPMYVAKMQERQGLLAEIARLQGEGPSSSRIEANDDLLMEMSWRLTTDALMKNY